MGPRKLTRFVVGGIGRVWRVRRMWCCVSQGITPLSLAALFSSSCCVSVYMWWRWRKRGIGNFQTNIVVKLTGLQILLSFSSRPRPSLFINFPSFLFFFFLSTILIFFFFTYESTVCEFNQHSGQGPEIYVDVPFLKKK